MATGSIETIGMCAFCTLPVMGQTGMRYTTGHIEHHACGDKIRKHEVMTAKCYTTFLRLVPVVRSLSCLNDFLSQLTDGLPTRLNPQHFLPLTDLIIARAEQETEVPAQAMDELRNIRKTLLSLSAHTS
jgi:hypothetical protein